MNPDPRYPDRVPRRYAERPPRSARDVRATRQRRYSPGPVQSTKALTTKLAMLAIVATLAVGGLIAAQMAAGNDPALGPKAAKAAKKASNNSASTGASTGASSSGGSGTDPSTVYGAGGYYSGSSSGSSGYSSGYSTQQSAPAPVTSSTS